MKLTLVSRVKEKKVKTYLDKKYLEVKIITTYIYGWDTFIEETTQTYREGMKTWTFTIWRRIDEKGRVESSPYLRYLRR